MPKFTLTELEKLSWSQQSWSEVMRKNMQLLEDSLLKVSGMLDVDLTGLQNNDILRWDVSSEKFKAVRWLTVFPLTTTTTTTTTTVTFTGTTTTAPPLTWLGDWAKRIEITLDKDQIDAALSGFPVPIYLSTASGIGDVDVSAIFDELTSDANRFKIAVTDSNHSELYVEIERWDDANEKAWLHVKVPSISASVDGTLYIYYDSSKSDNTTYVGDVGSTPGQTVWDSNFKAVYHLGEDPTGGSGCIKDSTSNANHGTPGGSMVSGDLVDGQFGKALDFDASDDEVNCGSGSNLDDITSKTIETIIDSNTLTGTQLLFSKISNIGGSFSDGWAAYITGPATPAIRFTQRFTTTLGRWRIVFALGVQHIAITYNNSSVGNDPLMYKNGVSQSVTEGSTPVGTAESDTVEDLIIGNDEGSTDYPFDGIIDEVRISDVIRTAAWIKATYKGLWDDLLTFGSEETYS